MGFHTKLGVLQHPHPITEPDRGKSIGFRSAKSDREKAIAEPYREKRR